MLIYVPVLCLPFPYFPSLLLRFSGQGLSNLVWGLRRLAGLSHNRQLPTASPIAAPTATPTAASTATPNPRMGSLSSELMGLLTREAVYKVDEFKPLGLLTFLDAWADAGCVHGAHGKHEARGCMEGVAGWGAWRQDFPRMGQEEPL